MRQLIVYFNSGAIGEFLMTLHFASLLESRADIYVAVRRNAASLVELAKPYPNVTVIDLEGKQFLRGVWQLLRIPSARTVLTQQTFSSHPLTLILLAYFIARAGFAGSRFIPFCDTQKITHALADETWKFDTSELFSNEMCRLARRFGYQGTCPVPRLRLADSEPITDCDPNTYIIFHLRAFTADRTPSVGQWRHLIEAARTITSPDVKFLLTGTPADSSYIDEVIKGISGCVNVSGVYSMVELARLIAHARGYIGPDTGITHLAAFVGTPSVVIGTRSTPCWWATYSPGVTWLTEAAHCTCVGVKTGACRTLEEGEWRYRCMVEVTPKMLADALNERGIA